jgi:hypothetical protein
MYNPFAEALKNRLPPGGPKGGAAKNSGAKSAARDGQGK